MKSILETCLVMHLSLERAAAELNVHKHTIINDKAPLNNLLLTDLFVYFLCINMIIIFYGNICVDKSSSASPPPHVEKMLIWLTCAFVLEAVKERRNLFLTLFFFFKVVISKIFMSLSFTEPMTINSNCRCVLGAHFRVCFLVCSHQSFLCLSSHTNSLLATSRDRKKQYAASHTGELKSECSLLPTRKVTTDTWVVILISRP